jgi:hypothetical protein
MAADLDAGRINGLTGFEKSQALVKIAGLGCGDGCEKQALKDRPSVSFSREKSRMTVPMPSPRDRALSPYLLPTTD